MLKSKKPKYRIFNKQSHDKWGIRAMFNMNLSPHIWTGKNTFIAKISLKN